MKKIIILSSLLIYLSVLSFAQTVDSEKFEISSVKVGGVSIKIPAPDITFTDVSNDHRGLVELFVPQSNRLLCAFLLKN